MSTRFLITYVNTQGIMHQFEIDDPGVAQKWLSYGVEQGYTHLHVRPIYITPARRKTWRDRVSHDDLAVAIIVLLTVFGIFLIQA